MGVQALSTNLNHTDPEVSDPEVSPKRQIMLTPFARSFWKRRYLIALAP